MRSASRPTIIRWRASCWSAKTAPTNAARGRPTVRRKCCRSTQPEPRRHAGLSRLAGPLRLPRRRARRCSTRSAERRDDLCVFDPTNPPSFCTPASLNQILTEDVPIADVLAFPPAPIVAPLAHRGGGFVVHRHRLRADSFVTGPVQRGAALYSLEGRFRVLGAECHRTRRPKSVMRSS